jgi:hypothetical protein
MSGYWEQPKSVEIIDEYHVKVGFGGVRVFIVEHWIDAHPKGKPNTHRYNVTTTGTTGFTYNMEYPGEFKAWPDEVRWSKDAIIVACRLMGWPCDLKTGYFKDLSFKCEFQER